jgi:hypothetical protein
VLIGRMVKPMALKDEVPMRLNSPTAKSRVIHDDRDVAKEKERPTGIRFAVELGGDKGGCLALHSLYLAVNTIPRLRDGSRDQ